MTPNPIQTVTATIKDKFAHGVGVESLVTLANVLNPYTGVPGLDDYPCMITSMTVDLDRCECRYSYRVAPGVNYGWVAACIIPANGSTIIDADTIRVDDISDDATGRNFCNVYPTMGWYDHWFFGPLKFNSTMSAPEEIAGALDKKIVVLQVDTTAPAKYTGLEAQTVSTGNYAAGGPFFYLEGAHVGFDVTKPHVVFFANRDTAGLTAQQEKWVYVADDSLEVQDSAAAKFTGSFWK